MSAMPVHAADGRECPRGQLGKFRDGEVPQIARHLAGIQKKSYIRRRNARRNSVRFLLHIIGNEPVVLLRAELGEVSPGADRGTP